MSLSMRNHVVTFFSKYGDEIDLPAIVFVRLKVDAEELADTLRGSGWLAAHVHGSVCKEVRTAVLDQLRSGALEIAVSTDCWSKGIDVPNLRSVVIACGGQAPIGLKQRSGRGSRLAEDKPTFTIYDLSGPEDKHREARRQHYLEGGFEVEGVGWNPETSKTSQTSKTTETSESTLLSKLLEEDSRPRPQSRASPSPSPSPSPSSEPKIPVKWKHSHSSPLHLGEVTWAILKHTPSGLPDWIVAPLGFIGLILLLVVFVSKCWAVL